MKKRSFHLSPGAPSLVLIVVVLSMSIMGMLMFIRTQNDKKLSQRSIQVAMADAALFEQAEKTYAALDALVAESKAQAANDEVFLEWHEWLAGIVREYFPNTPLHAESRLIFWVESVQGRDLFAGAYVYPHEAEERIHWYTRIVDAEVGKTWNEF